MQTHQRWSSAFINVVSTLIFGWKLSRRTFIDFVSTLTKQRWNKVDRITSIQSYNVEIWYKVEPMYIYRSCKTTLKVLRRFNVDTPALFQRWKVNVRWFNFHFQRNIRNINVETTLAYRRWIDVNVEKTALKKLYQYLLTWCLLESGSITKQI